jgi:hypothetical protein
MNRHKRTVVFAALAVLVAVGCAPWQYIGKEGMTWQRRPFTGTLPLGWVKMGTNLLWLTKNGSALEAIQITRFAVDKELPTSKKKFVAGILPQEAAQIVIDEFTLDKTINNFLVVENVPATLSGMPAFKLVATFDNQDGKKSRSIIYGFVLGKWFYEVRYIAAQQHYFNLSVKDFEAFVNGLQVEEI